MVAQVLAEGEISESFARTVCRWTDKLPADCRPDADAILVGAAEGGVDLRDLAELAAEIYARSLPEDPEDPARTGPGVRGPVRAGWKSRSRARGC